MRLYLLARRSVGAVLRCPVRQLDRSNHSTRRSLARLLGTRAPDAVLLVRLAVATVFLSEGVQKFLFAASLGSGRFAKIGIPLPAVTGPFVGAVEIACGLLVLLGLLTRVAALLLVANMTVALASTKLPILLGHGYWLFAHTFAPKAGWWDFLHESRTDMTMWWACAFLARVGAGGRSLDAVMSRGMRAP